MRQIGPLYYERLLASKDRRAVTVPLGSKSRGHQSLRIAEIRAPFVQRFMEETFGK